MKKKRIIPIFLLNEMQLVQSRNFNDFEVIGNPFLSIKRFSEWMIDELIYLNITRIKNSEHEKNEIKKFTKLIQEISKHNFMPITIGGKIKNLNQIYAYLKNGADKISINSRAFKDPKFINEAAREFGSQCIVVSIDVKKINNKYKVFIDNGSTNTNIDLVDWVDIIQSEGAGEILINSIDRDGSKTGYDFKILDKLKNKIKIPLIFCGGVGHWKDFKMALKKKEIDAVAAANIFHHFDQSDYLAKDYLIKNKIKNIRPPNFFKDK
jgi:imidazole glycerol-phosphate synthase subunit HisF